MMCYIVFKQSEGKWDMGKDTATQVDQARDEHVIKASAEASGSMLSSSQNLLQILQMVIHMRSRSWNHLEFVLALDQM